jgi:hypothetical protein
MTNESLLLLVLIILLVGALPAWPYSNSWGYGPTGGLAVVLAILLIYVIVEGRPLFRSTTDHDLQSAGRDAAASIRGAVQQ